MRAYPHGVWAHRQRVSQHNIFDSEKLWHIFLVLLTQTGFEPQVFGYESDALPTEPPRMPTSFISSHKTVKFVCWLLSKSPWRGVCLKILIEVQVHPVWLIGANIDHTRVNASARSIEGMVLLRQLLLKKNDHSRVHWLRHEKCVWVLIIHTRIHVSWSSIWLKKIVIIFITSISWPKTKS